MKRNLAFWIAAAALLVSAPRLAVTFVMADGVTLAPTVAVAVFAGTGIASGLVLTGGNVYIAHALAEHWRRRGGLWTVLLVAWLLFLVFAVWLIAPLLVYGLGHSALAEVLGSAGQRWAWAVTAALSVELLAAAAMAASVLSGEPTQTAPQKRTRSVADALTQRIVRTLDRDVSAAPTAASAAVLVTSAAPTALSAPAPTPPAFACPTCPRTFSSQQALAGHQRHCRSAQEGPGGQP